MFPAQWVIGMALTPDGHILGVLNTDFPGSFGGGYGIIVYGDFETASVLTQVKDSLGVYPNPASSVVHLNGLQSDVVTDALGCAYTVPNHDGTLDISSLPPGVYYISDRTHRARFVKE